VTQRKEDLGARVTLGGSSTVGRTGGGCVAGEGDGDALGFGDVLGGCRAPLQLPPAGWERGGLA